MGFVYWQINVDIGGGSIVRGAVIDGGTFWFDFDPFIPRKTKFHKKGCSEYSKQQQVHTSPNKIYDL